MSFQRQLAWATLLILPTAFGVVVGCDSACSDAPRRAACSAGDKECLNPQPELPFCGEFSPQPSLPGGPTGGTANSGEGGASSEGEGGASSEGEGGASSEGEGGSSSEGGAAEGGAGSVTK
jgi:hypothetical protein